MASSYDTIYNYSSCIVCLCLYTCAALTFDLHTYYIAHIYNLLFSYAL